MNVWMKSALLGGVAMGLSACGGGGTGATSYKSFLSETETGTTPIAGVSIDTGSGTMGTASGGTFNFDSGAFTLGAVSGTIVDGNGTLTGGGTITVEDDYTHVLLYSAQPTGGSTIYGVTGIPVQTGDMPSGTVSHAGVSKVLINDGSNLWALDGDMTSTFDLGAGSGEAVISGLDGRRIAATGAGSDVTDVATITLFDLSVADDGVVTGSDVGLNSAQITAFVTQDSVESVNGQLFGAQAGGFGGGLTMDDTGSGTIRMQAIFAGE